MVKGLLARPHASSSRHLGPQHGSILILLYIHHHLLPCLSLLQVHRLLNARCLASAFGCELIHLGFDSLIVCRL